MNLSAKAEVERQRKRNRDREGKRQRDTYLFKLLLLLELLLLEELLLHELVREGGGFADADAALVHHPVLGALPPLSEQFPAYRYRPCLGSHIVLGVFFASKRPGPSPPPSPLRGTKKKLRLPIFSRKSLEGA